MKSETKKTKWFEEWFDSPYYHVLYKDRDEKEAKDFILNLINSTTQRMGYIIGSILSSQAL